MSTPTPDSRIRFDKTVNLGHIISIVAFLLMTLTQWNMMDKRITVLEEFRTVQRERDAAQDMNAKDRAQEVKDAINDLKRSIEKLADRLGPK